MVGSPPPLTGPLAENCDAGQMAEITTQWGLLPFTSSGKSIICYQLEIKKLILLIMTIHFFWFPMTTSWQCQLVALFLGNRELGGAWEQGWSARVFSDLKLVTELFLCKSQVRIIVFSCELISVELHRLYKSLVLTWIDNCIAISLHQG